MCNRKTGPERENNLLEVPPRAESSGTPGLLYKGRALQTGV